MLAAALLMLWAFYAAGIHTSFLHNFILFCECDKFLQNGLLVTRLIVTFSYSLTYFYHFDWKKELIL